MIGVIFAVLYTVGMFVSYNVYAEPIWNSGFEHPEYFIVAYSAAWPMIWASPFELKARKISRRRKEYYLAKKSTVGVETTNNDEPPADLFETISQY